MNLFAVKALSLPIALGMFLIQASQPNPSQSPTRDSKRDGVTDDGFGTCAAFSHEHADDHACHRDDNDGLILTIDIPPPASPALDSPELKTAMSHDADIADLFRRIYQSKSYPYMQYVSADFDLVKADLAAISVITDPAEFIAASGRLSADYGKLDAIDDMLRVSDII